MIYLDYAATAPMAPKAIEALSNNLNSKEMYANPSSLQHSFGQKANNLVKNCRSEFASDLNCNPNDLIFTSGATESNNLAIKGIELSYRYKGQHIVTSASEHKSVLDTCKFLESIGYQVTYLRPDTNGRIDQDCLLAALTDKTTLVSLMDVNNETGVIQDIDQIAKTAAISLNLMALRKSFYTESIKVIELHCVKKGISRLAPSPSGRGLG